MFSLFCPSPKNSHLPHDPISCTKQNKTKQKRFCLTTRQSTYLTQFAILLSRQRVNFKEKKIEHVGGTYNLDNIPAIEVLSFILDRSIVTYPANFCLKNDTEMIPCPYLQTYVHTIVVCSL